MTNSSTNTPPKGLGLALAIHGGSAVVYLIQFILFYIFNPIDCPEKSKCTYKITFVWYSYVNMLSILVLIGAVVVNFMERKKSSAMLTCVCGIAGGVLFIFSMIMWLNSDEKKGRDFLEAFGVEFSFAYKFSQILMWLGMLLGIACAAIPAAMGGLKSSTTKI